MPVHRYQVAGLSGRFMHETFVFPGEISSGDYFGNALRQPSVPGHTPSVGYRVPTEFRISEAAKSACMKAIEDRVHEFFSSPRGAFYASFCHDGAYIFFARPIDKTDFLDAMKGDFTEFAEADDKNLKVVQHRHAAGFKPESEVLGADYAVIMAAPAEMPAPAKQRVRVRAGTRVEPQLVLTT